MTSLPDDVHALFDGPNYAHVATLMPDGAPHSVPVWIGVEAGRVAFLTSPGSRKARNLAHDRASPSPSPPTTSRSRWPASAPRGRAARRRRRLGGDRPDLAQVHGPAVSAAHRPRGLPRRARARMGAGVRVGAPDWSALERAIAGEVCFRAPRATRRRARRHWPTSSTCGRGPWCSAPPRRTSPRRWRSHAGSGSTWRRAAAATASPGARRPRGS